MLATLTRAPSVFSPRRDLAAAQSRADHVLQAMVETGAITQAQANDARATPAVVSDRAMMDARISSSTAADEAMKLDRSVGRQCGDHRPGRAHDDGAGGAGSGAAGRAQPARAGPQGACERSRRRGDEDRRRRRRTHRRRRLRRERVQSRDPGAPPARLRLQAFRLSGRPRNRVTPWDTRDDQPVDIDGWTPTNYGGRSYGTMTLATGAGPFRQHDHGESRAGGRHSDDRDRGGAALRHRLAARSQCLARARHQRGHAAGAHDRLCRLRLGRQSASIPISSAGSRRRPSRALPENSAAAAAHHREPCRPRPGGDALWRASPKGRDALRPRRPRSRGQDGNDAGLSRRLVRRLHHGLRDQRVGRQRRFLADEGRNRRHAASHDLARGDDGGGEEPARDAARQILRRGARRRFRSSRRDRRPFPRPATTRRPSPRRNRPSSGHKAAATASGTGCSDTSATAATTASRALRRTAIAAPPSSTAVATTTAMATATARATTATEHLLRLGRRWLF